MPLYVIIFPENDAGALAYMRENMHKIFEFQENLARSGKLIWSERFYPASKEAACVIADASGNQSVQSDSSDGPSLGGYSVINAEDLHEATELIKAFPYKAPNSRIEVRRIMDLNDSPMPEQAKAKAKELREIMAKNAAALTS